MFVCLAKGNVWLLVQVLSLPAPPCPWGQSSEQFSLKSTLLLLALPSPLPFLTSLPLTPPVHVGAELQHSHFSQQGLSWILPTAPAVSKTFPPLSSLLCSQPPEPQHWGQKLCSQCRGRLADVEMFSRCLTPPNAECFQEEGG